MDADSSAIPPERKGDPLYDFKLDRSHVVRSMKKLLRPLSGLLNHQASSHAKIQKMNNEKSLMLKALKPSVKALKDLPAEAKATAAAIDDEAAEKRFALQLQVLQQELTAASAKVQQLMQATRQTVSLGISRLPPNSPFPTLEKIDEFLTSYLADQTAAIVFNRLLQEKAPRPAPTVVVPDEQVALKDLIDARIKLVMKNPKSKNSRGRAGKPAAAQAQQGPGSSQKNKKTPGKKPQSANKKKQQKKSNKTKPKGQPKAASGPGRSKSKQRKRSKKEPAQDTRSN
jgi:hypothetical protein